MGAVRVVSAWLTVLFVISSGLGVFKVDMRAVLVLFWFSISVLPCCYGTLDLFDGVSKGIKNIKLTKVNTLLSILGVDGDNTSNQAPRPSYGAPKPSNGAPKPSYEAPKPSYGAPGPSYEAPKPSYGAPEPSYNAQKPANAGNKPSYKPPKPSYEAPKPS